MNKKIFFSGINFFQIRLVSISLLLFCIIIFQNAKAEPIKILEWNISGNEVAMNVGIITNIFATEDADILALQEVSQGSTSLYPIITPDYTQLVGFQGQEIWVRKGNRFNVIETDTIEGGRQGSVSATIEDTLSGNALLHLYSSHFPIPDSFFGRPGTLPDVNNEAQQEHICVLIGMMEENASTGTVILAADFNDSRLEEGEDLIAFLEGTGALTAGFCETTDIGMVEVVLTDVTHILGTGGLNIYSDTNFTTTTEVGFGQHGYVVTSVDLSLIGGVNYDVETSILSIPSVSLNGFPFLSDVILELVNGEFLIRSSLDAGAPSDVNADQDADFNTFTNLLTIPSVRVDNELAYVDVTMEFVGGVLVLRSSSNAP